MELTKKHVVTYLKMISVQYPKEYSSMSIEDKHILIDMWYESLKQYDSDVVLQALTNVLQACEYAPKLAHICNEIRRMESCLDDSSEKLWYDIVDVLYDVRYNCEGYKYNAVQDNGKTQGENCIENNRKIFESLPYCCKQYLNNMRGLISIAYMDNEQLNFEKARFMKRIPEIKEKNRTMNKLPSGVKQLLLQTSKRLCLE